MFEPCLMGVCCLVRGLRRALMRCKSARRRGLLEPSHPVCLFCWAQRRENAPILVTVYCTLDCWNCCVFPPPAVGVIRLTPPLVPGVLPDGTSRWSLGTK